MAGDWIKMRADLFTHPKVIRMMSALKADTLRTVGGLMSVWCLFDAHSIDGHLDGYSLEVLDEHLRWTGFAQAMVSVGWLEECPGEGLKLPRFDSHNGQSAKRRAQDADRKREDRKTSASEADKKRTREEKRREEINTPQHPKGLLRFSEFWASWPKSERKGAKAKCEEVWAKRGYDLEADTIMAHVKRMAETEQWRKEAGQYVPAPLVYLNGRRWDGADLDQCSRDRMFEGAI